MNSTATSDITSEPASVVPTERPLAAGSADGREPVADGPPFLGNDCDRYNNLLACVRETLAPVDVLEQLWMHDVVDLAWESMELRRLRAGLMKAAEGEGMKLLLGQFTEQPANLAGRWLNREESGVRLVQEKLARAGMTGDHVAASTFAARMNDFDRIDRMIAASEARRNAALRELARYRAGFASRLRRTLAALEEGGQGGPVAAT